MRDKLQEELNNKVQEIEDLEYKLRESKARESVDTAIEFYQ